MNELIYPEIREMRKIKKRITNPDFGKILDSIEKYLGEGDPTEPQGTRIKDLQNQYSFPEYRMRHGDYRVLYCVEKRTFVVDRVLIVDIIHKKDWSLWLRKYGVQKR